VSGTYPQSRVPQAGEITPADELFLNLDGTIVNVSLQSWRIEVCGIHSSHAQNWVQLHVWGNTSYGLTLCLEALDAAPIRRMLVHWLPNLSFPSGSIELCPAHFAV
jgi:hypothetical protein